MTDAKEILKAFSGVWYRKGGEIRFSCHLALVDWGFYVLDESMTIGEGTYLPLDECGKTWALTEKELRG